MKIRNIILAFTFYSLLLVQAKNQNQTTMAMRMIRNLQRILKRLMATAMKGLKAITDMNMKNIMNKKNSPWRRTHQK